MTALSFWKKLRKQGVCLIWPGRVDENGYGVCRRVVRGKVVNGAHRVAFVLMNEREPRGVLRNTCGDRACCNPAHWQEVKAPAKRVTTRRRMIRALAEQGQTMTEISRNVGVSRTTVWRHLSS
jgi:transcriptional regulator with GAF, ATPase, and Fis domain